MDGSNPLALPNETMVEIVGWYLEGNHQGF